ncbi:TonB-dependent receptor domain-containing protein [Pelomonas aquatica]|jgi:vitamin B12 transporter|uniref:TonB-dependent receptor n=1 Tax=Pelomonas aquatica TaxID=431058 RepID=A0A9X4LHF3_9BURK|nr:TonB-dependent receptor [Pelomonas aquatica]MCY4753603.1 TonB-dependent receptor [Pelomonas aquatica]MDG0863253.1 TonB-dependent receptor [Pelomonas aquatica]
MSHSFLAARRPLLALSALALAASAHAQNRLDTIVTTATRMPQRVSEVLADITVLTREDISARAFGGLADLLAAQPGVQIARNGGPGSTTSVFVRGANTQHTVVLVDGVRMDTQSGSGGAPWEAMGLAQVERIEILRGPASAVYGSDAIGGVIQIFTRKGESTPQLVLHGAIGNLGTAKGDLSFSGKQGDWDYALGAALETSDGFSTMPDQPGLADPDGWRNHSLQGRLGYAVNDQHRLSLAATRSHVNAQYDSTFSPPNTDDRAVNDARSLRATWAAQWTSAWQSELSASESNARYETLANGVSGYLTETRVRAFAWANQVALPVGRLSATLERREDVLLNSSLRPSTHGSAERSQNALALGYLLNLGAFDGQAHWRHDRDSDFGSINTGSLAAGWRFTPEWRAWASAGTAFRAPTLYQSFSQYGPLDTLPALKPEHGRNKEVGLRWARGEQQLSLTAYDNRIRDLINYDSQFALNCPATDPLNVMPWDGCYGNVARVHLRGATLQGQTELAGWHLQASFDWQNPRDEISGGRLGRRAPRYASLQLDKAVGDWSGSLGMTATAQRPDRNGGKQLLGGYALVNASLAYRINPQARLQLNVDNAFDRVYQTARGYAQPPRTVMLGVTLTPKL